jgi:hypothetical protein
MNRPWGIYTTQFSHRLPFERRHAVRDYEDHGLAETYGPRLHGGRDEEGGHPVESFKPADGERTYLDRPGQPLFLQFKLSQFMHGWNAREFQGPNPQFSQPFYRMHV